MTAPSRIAPALPRWWSHPAAVAAFHLSSVLVGLAAATPLAAMIAEVMGSFAGVDATLFDDGGVLLAELWRAQSPLTGRILLNSGALVLAGLAVGLAATAALLGAMGAGGPHPFTTRIRAVLFSLPGMGALFLLATSARLALAALAWSVARPVLGFLEPGSVGRDLATAAAIVAIAALVAIVSALQDLARAAFAGARLGFLDSLQTAATALSARPIRLLGAFAMRSLTSGMLLLSAALLTFRVGMRDSSSAWASLALLEIALVAATCLRASWLGLALDAVLPRPAGTALPDGDDSSRKSPSAPR